MPGSGKGNPELPNQGEYKIGETEQNSENVEECVAGLRFERGGKLELAANKL